MANRGGQIDEGGVLQKPTPAGLYGTLDPAIAGRIVNEGGTVPAAYNPQPATTAPGTNTGGGGSSSNTNAAPTDWSTILGEYGLPPDVIAQLNIIWANAAGNVSEAVTLAQAYVRGTDWYKTTYPGIQQGINAGLFGDEQSYRTYQNQVNQLYQQYYSRAATTAELTGYITKGQAAGQVANQLHSAAMQGTISDPLKSLFSPDELKALTDEQSGIDTAAGQQITQKVNLATSVGDLYQSFYGRPLTRAELDTLTSQGLDAGAVARNFATQENIKAMNPAISGLFTPAEIQQIASHAAGGTTQSGQALTDMASLAAQLNQVYQTYHGTTVTRDELNQAYQSGYSAQMVANALQTSSVLGSLPSYLGGLFTPEQLQKVAQQQSGQTDTAEGRTLANLAQNADSYNQVFQQFMGRNVSLAELTDYVNSDTSAAQVRAKLQAGDYAGSLPTSVSSLFTPDELAQAGAQASGSAQSAGGARILNVVQNAGGYAAAATQYGETLTGDQIKAFYDQGVSASQYANRLQGKAYAAANAPDIQQASGSFGEGQLSPEQLQSLGQEATGMDTPDGAKLLAAYNKAVQRMHGAFTGTLARPGSFAAGTLRQAQQTPDTAA